MPDISITFHVMLICRRQHIKQIAIEKNHNETKQITDSVSSVYDFVVLLLTMVLFT